MNAICSVHFLHRYSLYVYIVSSSCKEFITPHNLVMLNWDQHVEEAALLDIISAANPLQNSKSHLLRHFEPNAASRHLKIAFGLLYP